MYKRLPSSVYNFLKHFSLSLSLFSNNMHKIIHTDKAPEAIGTYVQATKSHPFVFLSGQIGLQPKESIDEITLDFDAQVLQIIKNLQAVCRASGGELQHIVKLNVYLTDLNYFPNLNQVMEAHWPQPFPARAAIEVSALPKKALLEIDGMMVLDNPD